MSKQAKDMMLTDIERELIEAYNVQAQALFEAHVAPSQVKLAACLRRVEERTGLPAGSIGDPQAGATHTIDNAGRIVPLATPETNGKAWADPLETTAAGQGT